MWAVPEKTEEPEEPRFPWETRWDDTRQEDLDYDHRGEFERGKESQPTLVVG